MNHCKHIALLSGITLSVIFQVGCAGLQARHDQEKKDDSTKQEQVPASTSSAQAPMNESPRTTPLAVSARLDAVEAKLSAMNDKLDATRMALDGFLAAHSTLSTPMVQAVPPPVQAAPMKNGSVPNRSSDTVGMAVNPGTAPTDPESGFVTDEAVQLYRKAEILLESQRYPDALLAFSGFLEKYPDHAFAGSAQFHVGEAYFKQGEFKQAEQEFQKVLTSYDRSVHIADTLRIMAEAEDHLGKTQESARHRQQLSSLFANSPSAQNLGDQAEVKPVQAASEAKAGSTASGSNAEPDPTEIPASPVTKAAKPSLDEPPPTAPVPSREKPSDQ
jgi:TolA-binding protein